MLGCDKLFLLSAIAAFLHMECRASFGCQLDQKLCSPNARCAIRGFCICDTYYYGKSCEYAIAENNRATFVNGGFTDGELAGIILGNIIGWPLVTVLVYWCVFKQE